MTEVTPSIVTIDNLYSIYEQDLLDYNNLVIDLEIKKLRLCFFMYDSFDDMNVQRIIVDKDSLNINFKRVANAFIEHILEKYMQKMKPMTIHGDYTLFFYFLKWAKNNNQNYLDSKISARKVFEYYTLHLSELSRLDKIRSKTASRRHQIAIKILERIYDDKERYIAGSTRILSRDNNDTRHTLASSEEDKAIVLKFNTKIFLELTDFLLEKKKFPYLLDIGEEKLWLFPRKTFLVRNKGKQLDNADMGFCYDTGKIKSVKQIQQEYNYFKCHAIKKRTYALNKINYNNRNKYTDIRLLLARHASYAFFMLFLGATGLNEAGASQLTWNEEYRIDKNKQKFKTIKFRANNKPVEFEIQSRFMNYFKKYILLRDYMLKNEKFDFLFFSLDKEFNPYIPRMQYSTGYVVQMIRTLSNTYNSDLPRINSRQIRKNTVDSVRKKNGVIASSLLSQTSLTENLNSYTSESSDDSEKQFSQYFSKLNENIFNHKNKETEITTGYCKSYNTPQTEQELTSIEVNCIQQEGCLFCEHFCVHSEEEDIRKLSSLEYVIEQSKYISKNDEQFNSIFGIVIDRIKNIRELMVTKFPLKKKIIEQVHSDVYENENLTPYWEYKLRSLYEIGVLK